MDFDDRITIVTPEGIDLELTLAGVGSRAIAAIIDAAIKLVLITAVIVAFFGGTTLFDSTFRETADPFDAFLIGVAISVVIIFVVNFFYDVLFETLASGRTPGKRMTGLRVVRTGGGSVGFTASAIRNLLRIVDVLPTAYGVGIISVVVSSKNQRLGDMVAGTLVVRERQRAGLAAPVKQGRGADLQTLDVSALSAADVATIRSFLERRSTISPEARARLAQELSERVRAKVGGAIGDTDAEGFLEDVAATKSART